MAKPCCGPDADRQKEDTFGPGEGPLEAARALDEVQTSPPCSPQKALMAAVEFM